jgi:hypothetical protein
MYSVPVTDSHISELDNFVHPSYVCVTVLLSPVRFTLYQVFIQQHVKDVLYTVQYSVCTYITVYDALSICVLP